MIRQEEFEQAKVGQIWVTHLSSIRYKVIDVQRVHVVGFAVVTLRDERGQEIICVWWDHVCELPSRKKNYDLSLPEAHILQAGEDE